MQQLEQQYHFSYPQLYLRLYADGMLDWGKFGPDWITQQYPRLREKPPLLLFANEFELMSIADIQSQLEEFADPGHWMNIRPGLRFIPFAQTGAGDWYCFYLNGQQDADIPIVLLWHDANRAEYKAKNLQDFIFLYMLEAVADIEAVEDGLWEEEGFAADLQNWISTHSPYLTEKQARIVREIYTMSDELPISAEHLQQILAEEVYFDNMDQSFSYRNES